MEPDAADVRWGDQHIGSTERSRQYADVRVERHEPESHAGVLPRVHGGAAGLLANAVVERGLGGYAVRSG